MSFTPITVTGTYVRPDGAVESGTVRFMLTQEMTQSDGSIAPQLSQTVTLDGSGHISIGLWANDDPATVTPNATYTVTELIGNSPTHTYTIVVPHSAPSGTINLSELWT